jgi:hypothetical protein
LKNSDIEKLTKRKSENSYSNKSEGVTHNGDTAKYSLSKYSIIESVKKVNKKDDKKTFFKILSKANTDK